MVTIRIVEQRLLLFSYVEEDLSFYPLPLYSYPFFYYYHYWYNNPDLNH